MTADLANGYILVGVDGSQSALRAVRWAAQEAHHRRARVLIAHVVTPRQIDYESPLSVDDQVEMHGHDIVAAAEYRIEKHFPSVRSSVTVVAGDPTRSLIELSRGALLTAVGATGRGRVRAAVFGSVAMAMISRGHSPVAVIRVPEYYGAVQTGPVVVGVGGDDDGESALAWAFDEASRRHTCLVSVHTWDTRSTPTSLLESSMAEMQARNARVTEERATLAERLAGWQEQYPDVPVTRIVRQGRPVDELVDIAEHAQLIVVGSRGHGERSGALFDSVTRMLIRRAPCSVLVARRDSRLNAADPARSTPARSTPARR